MSDFVRHNEDRGEAGGRIGLTVTIHHAELADDAVVDVGTHARYGGQS